MEAEIPF